MKKRLKNSARCVCLVLLCHGPLLYAEGAPSVTNSKMKLQQLESKMTQLQRTLHVTRSRREVLQQEIARSEKEISETIRQLATIRRNIAEKQQQIEVLKQLIATLNRQRDTQQALLARHIRARYKIGNYQPMKWLLNQENPYTINRVLTYYHYVVKARQKTIQEVLETEARLHQNQEKLNQESLQQQLLQEQVKKRQEKLNQDNQYHAALIQSLDKDMQNKQQILHEYQHDKATLSQLINHLAQQGISSHRTLFLPTRHRLPKPVIPIHTEKMNQGLIFYANEGAAVNAVSPGKVVFSDWLNGYGLLLIIDHGNGLMTLYAHNQALFKQKGAIVDTGEKIAAVGHTGGLHKNGLYFEIRRNGKAISPTSWIS